MTTFQIKPISSIFPINIHCLEQKNLTKNFEKNVVSNKFVTQYVEDASKMIQKAYALS